MKKVLAILTAVLMLTVALIGCGGGAGGSAGTYKFKSMSAGGMEVTRESLQQILDIAAAAGGEKMNVDDVMKLELTNDGKFKMGIYQEEDVEGTYEVSGETIKMTADGETLEGTLKGNTLTISMEGESIVFEK